MMTETTTSSSSSAVKSARLEAVTTTPPSDESAELDIRLGRNINLCTMYVKVLSHATD